MEFKGKITKCLGERFSVDSENGILECYARGNFRHGKISPVVGDNVIIECDGEYKNPVISSIIPRKNYLIRPQIANIDTMFVAVSPKKPVCSLLNTDKLLCVAVDLAIHPIVIITKKDIDADGASKLESIYKNAGFDVIVTTYLDKEETREKIFASFHGDVCAFAGPSGVGKSTAIESVFPDLKIKTGELSPKTGHGRHTTKECTLFEIPNQNSDTSKKYIADTPGFSLIDFDRFFFMERDNLPFSFPEFREYLTLCKYTKCSHTSEEGCKIIEAVKNGKISESRHESYIALYNEMKSQKKYKK